MNSDVLPNKNYRSLSEAILNIFNHKINIIDRTSDTEFKLLEVIYRLIQDKTDPENFDKVVGIITIESERAVCESCWNVITTFAEFFPKINIIVRSYYGDEHSKYEENGVIFAPNFLATSNIR